MEFSQIKAESEYWRNNLKDEDVVQVVFFRMDGNAITKVYTLDKSTKSAVSTTFVVGRVDVVQEN